MVALHTNRPEYQSDIADEIRAFLGDVPICFAEEPDNEALRTSAYAVWATLAEEQGERHALAFVRGEGRETRYAYHAPAPADESALLRKRYEKRAVKIAVFRAMRALLPQIALPWGSLTGIRPTRLLRELIEGEGEARALAMMAEEFDVRPDKLRLARTITQVQQPLLSELKPHDAGVYIGIPFCKTRCLYCSFASETMGKGLDAYLDTLYRDIAGGAAIFRETGFVPRSVYIGGGTPTVLSAEALAALIAHVRASYGFERGELTVEAGRPDTITEDKLLALRRSGVTRIAINPQTMQDETLRRIGRAHTAADVVAAFHMAREAGFACINMDLIAGLPGETVEEFRDTLEQAAALRPENLTIHTLAIKRSSKLRERLAEYALPTPEEAEKMVALGAQCAEKLGLRVFVKRNFLEMGKIKRKSPCGRLEALFGGR